MLQRFGSSESANFAIFGHPKKRTRKWQLALLYSLIVHADPESTWSTGRQKRTRKRQQLHAFIFVDRVWDAALKFLTIVESKAKDS